jgi:hypothetical protein
VNALVHAVNSAFVAGAHFAADARTCLCAASNVRSSTLDEFSTVVIVEELGLPVTFVADFNTLARTTESTEDILQTTRPWEDSLMSRFGRERERDKVI